MNDSSSSKNKMSSWTSDEISLFLEGLDDYGPSSKNRTISRSRRWKMIAAHVGTKNEKEAKEYAKMYLSQMKSNTSLSEEEEGLMRIKSRPVMGKFARSDSLSKVPIVDEGSLEVTDDTWSYDEVRTDVNAYTM